MNVIGRIESGNNPAAIRFEARVFGSAPDLSPIIATIGKCNACNNATARVLYSCSFGEYQIMGFNLWGALDYRYNLARYLVNSADQAETFAAFLDVNKINFTLADLLSDPAKLDQFAATYNGNVAAYSAAILRAAQS